MVGEQKSRFAGLTSNGALPGGARGQYVRQLEGAYGIQPHVNGGDSNTEHAPGDGSRRGQYLSERGHKPKPKGHWKVVGTHGTRIWYPDPE